MICPKCGAENSPGNRFCDNCGAKLLAAPAGKKDKDREKSRPVPAPARPEARGGEPENPMLAPYASIGPITRFSTPRAT